MMIIMGVSLSAMVLHASPCFALFSGVVVPLYHLASRNDRMRYDAPQDSC